MNNFCCSHLLFYICLNLLLRIFADWQQINRPMKTLRKLNIRKRRRSIRTRKNYWCCYYSFQTIQGWLVEIILFVAFTMSSSTLYVSIYVFNIRKMLMRIKITLFFSSFHFIQIKFTIQFTCTTKAKRFNSQFVLINSDCSNSMTWSALWMTQI